EALESLAAESSDPKLQWDIAQVYDNIAIIRGAMVGRGDNSGAVTALEKERDIYESLASRAGSDPNVQYGLVTVYDRLGNSVPDAKAAVEYYRKAISIATPRAADPKFAAALTGLYIGMMLRQGYAGDPAGALSSFAEYQRSKGSPPDGRMFLAHAFARYLT